MQSECPSLFSNSRLTANRVLRIRKILHYVSSCNVGSPEDCSISLTIYCQITQIYEHLGMEQTSRKASLSSIVSSSHPFPAVAAAAAASLASARNAAVTGTAGKAHEENDSSRVKPEKVIEVLCQGIVVPITMNLAACRQFIWVACGPSDAGGNDVVLQYRMKK